MHFDKLTEQSAPGGWGESTVVTAFDAAWDRELFGLDVPPWRKSVVQLVQQAQQHFGGERIVVADIGCGCAPYARHLLESGIDFEYHGYDHNESVLHAACQRWAFLPQERVHLHLMDARHGRWPVEDDAFDVVIWDTTLRFCEDLHEPLAQSARVCRGWVILARTPIEARGWCEQVHFYDMNTPSADWHFDHALLTRLADENRMHLSLNAGRDDTHVLSHDPWTDDLSLPPAPRLSRIFHEAFVRERVSRLFRERPGRWIVYGAGQHSRWLMTILPEALRRRVTHFLDDAAPAGFTIDTVPVALPDEIDPSGVAGVLVSSDVLELGLYERAIHWCSSAKAVHCLYDGLPTGPYDKCPPAFAPPADMKPRWVASSAGPRAT